MEDISFNVPSYSVLALSLQDTGRDQTVDFLLIDQISVGLSRMSALISSDFQITSRAKKGMPRNFIVYWMKM